MPHTWSAFVLALFIFTPAWAQPLRPAEQREPEPLIPNDPNAYTQAQFEKEVLIPLYTKLLVDTYKDKGIRDPKWDAEALKFLEDLVRFEAGGPAMPGLTAVHDQARHLEDTLKCKDPLILYYRRRLEIQEDERYRIDIVDNSLKAFEEKGYPILLRAMGAELQIAGECGWGDQSKVPARAQVAFDLWVKAFKDPSNRGEAQRALYHQFVNLRLVALKVIHKDEYKHSGFWIGIADRMLADQEVDGWSANVMKGYLENRIAWEERGGGFANTVKPEGWKGFEEHLKIAERHLKAAYAANLKRPEAPHLLMSIAAMRSPQPVQELITWFKRTVNAQVDYEDAYHTMAWYLMPRWYGNHDAMLRFGVACTQTQRYDTIIPLQLGRILKTIEKDLDSWDPLVRTGAVAEVVKVYQKMEQEPRWDPARRRLRSEHMAFAARMDDWAEAYRVLKIMDKPPVNIGTQAANYFPAVLARHVGAWGGPAAEVVREADNKFNLQNLEGAAAVYQKALEQLGDEDLGRDYIEDRIQGIAWRQAFDRGGWVDLTVDSSLKGWEVRRGSWKATDDGILMGQAPEATHHPLILCEGWFGHRLELTAEIEMPAKLDWKWYSVGPVFCYTTDPVWRFRTALIYPNSDGVRVTRDFVYGDFVELGYNVPHKVSVRVLVYDKANHVYVNGKLVHDSPWLKPTENAGIDERIGFGSRNSGSDDVHWFKISNIRIRKLKELPEEMK